jgi:hypothetical protein
MELKKFNEAQALNKQIDELIDFIYQLDRSDIHFCKIQTSENTELQSLLSLPLWLITHKDYPKNDLENEIIILKEKIVDSYRQKLKVLQEEFKNI